MTYMLSALETPINHRRLYNGINSPAGMKMKLYNELNSKTTSNIQPPHIIFDACTRKQVSEL